MKRGKRIMMVSLVALCLIAGGTVVVQNSLLNAAETPEREVQVLVENYISALKNSDVDALVSIAIDKRFPDREVQRKEYENISKDDVLYDAKILSVKKQDNENLIVHLQAKTKNAGRVEIELPVVQKDEGWKIIVGQDIPYNPGNFTEPK